MKAMKLLTLVSLTELMFASDLTNFAAISAFTLSFRTYAEYLGV